VVITVLLIQFSTNIVTPPLNPSVGQVILNFVRANQYR